MERMKKPIDRKFGRDMILVHQLLSDSTQSQSSIFLSDTTFHPKNLCVNHGA